MTRSRKPRKPSNNAPVAPMPDDDHILCHCIRVTRLEIRQAIADGAKTVEDLQRATGACTGCHSCYPDCQNLLKAPGKEKNKKSE